MAIQEKSAPSTASAKSTITAPGGNSPGIEQPKEPDVADAPVFVPTPDPTPAPVADPALPIFTGPYLIDNATHTAIVNPTGNVVASLNTVFSTLLNRGDKGTRWTVRLGAGTYTLNTPVLADRIANVEILSDPAKPAVFVKGPSWNGEYIFYCRYCSDTRISGVTFKGKMTTFNPADTTVHWTDQGVFLGSAHDMRVDHNKFYDIGNAAVRAGTHPTDPVLGVNAWNVTIEDNYFENVWQITTTSDDPELGHGGTRGFVFQRNTIKDLRGSVKYCSRTDGAYDAKILNNTWLSSSDVALELCSVRQVLISGNSFSNIANFVMNAYTNNRQINGKSVASFAWGSDITIANNVSDGSGFGYRFSFDAYADGYHPAGNKITFDRNRVNNVASGAVFRIVNGAATAVTLSNNVFTQIVSGQAWSFTSMSTPASINNTLNGVTLR